MNLRQRLQFWANQRGAWTHILMGAGIAVLILIIAMASCVPSKGLVRTNSADIAEMQGTVDVNTNSLGTKASQAALDALESDVTDAMGDQAADLSELDERTAIAETKLAQARTDIATIQGQIDAVINSPLSATLAGTFGNYTLSVKSDEAGNFTAKVHLGYSPPMWVDGGNTTIEEVLAEFSSCFDWVTPNVAYNGTAWAANEIIFSVGTFELGTDTEKTLDITCAGLNSTWTPSYVYVEVYKAL